jgi:pimeloyl-ACP methyl ester carboxylesterase
VKKHNMLIWITGTAASVLIAVAAVSWLLSSLVVKPKTWDYNATFEEEIKKGALLKEKYETEYHPKEFGVVSSDGFPIHGIVLSKRPDIIFQDKKKRIAVFAHGYSYTLFGSFKYAEIFRNLGFICILFDERNHGKSWKTATTMGYNEAKDIEAVCRWARRKYGDDCIIGTHGESMGAAAVMMHAPSDPQLSFVIEDCGFSDLTEELQYQLKHSYHLPKFPFLPLASIFSQLRGGVAFKKVRPAQAVAQCSSELPMLFIHGTMDTFVPSSMVQKNYDAKQGNKSIHLFEGSEHARSWFDHPQQYAEVIESFLRENHII